MKRNVLHFSYTSLCKYIFDTALIILYYIHYLSSLHSSSMVKVMLHL